MKPNYLICQHNYSLLKDCIKDKDKTIYDCEHLLQLFNDKDCSIYGFKKPQIFTKVSKGGFFFVDPRIENQLGEHNFRGPQFPKGKN